MHFPGLMERSVYVLCYFTCVRVPRLSFMFFLSERVDWGSPESFFFVDNNWTTVKGCFKYVCDVCACYRFSHGWLFEIPWTVACQPPLSMGFSRQEYWSRFPFPSPGDLSDPGTEPTFFTSPALAGRFFTTSTTWEAPCVWQKWAK